MGYHMGPMNRISMSLGNGMIMPITEQSAIDQLRKSFADFDDSRVHGAKSQDSIAEAWMKNIDRLTELVLTSDPRGFLQWDVLLKTMVVGNADFVRDELNFLKERPDWDSRWKAAIEESPVGRPTYYDGYSASSGNLIHQAYHLAMFEKTTGMHIQDAGLILEFGGGYGSMCRTVFNLKFKGQYIIFDLPQFAALQRFYLNLNGISTSNSTDSFDKGVIIISDLKQLDGILSDHVGIDNKMFIANWSLSEAPVSMRHAILPLVASFKAFLIAFQGLFNKVDNLEFFTNWSRELKNVEWHSWKIKHLPNNFYRDNYYLMGRRK